MHIIRAKFLDGGFAYAPKESLGAKVLTELAESTEEMVLADEELGRFRSKVEWDPDAGVAWSLAERQGSTD